MKYETNIGENYLKDWTLKEAVREILQNCIDQQRLKKDNEMTIEVDGNTIRIGNKESVLERETLVLGETGKSDDPNAIGKYGEGYKVASLVFVRNGIEFKIYNYKKREVWEALLEDSKYKRKVLKFNVVRKKFWEKVPEHNLIFEMKGFSSLEEINELLSVSLKMHDYSNKIETEFGEILLDDKFGSKIYIGGLFVCENKNIKYGYNIKPSYLSLDRDRKLVDNFELTKLTSEMWSTCESEKEEYRSIVFDMMNDNIQDIVYINYYWKFKDEGYYVQRFKEKYGDKSVPLPLGKTSDDVKEGYVGVSVASNFSAILNCSNEFYDIYQEPKLKRVLNELKNEIDIIHDMIPNSNFERIKELLKEIESEI